VSKTQRARAIIAAVLLADAAITWFFFKEDSGALSPPGDTGLLWTLPSVAALLRLLRSKDLSGAKLAQVVAWGFVFVGTLGWTFVTLFSLGASSSDRFWGSALIGGLLAAQMLIPSAVHWGRNDVTFFGSLRQNSIVFAGIVLITIIGLLAG
jgi:hypothetical protein